MYPGELSICNINVAHLPARKLGLAAKGWACHRHITYICSVPPKHASRYYVVLIKGPYV
jgi:hypothetical protein